MAYLLQGPTEALNYTCDYINELDSGSPSDTISTSSWAVTPLDDASPAAPLLSSESQSGNTTTVTIENLTLGRIYRLTNTVITGQGLTLARSIEIRCEKR